MSGAAAKRSHQMDAQPRSLNGLLGGTRPSLSRASANSMDESGHGASTTLLWDLAPARAVEDTPQSKILGKVLVMMLDPRSHEQEVA